MAEYSPIDIIVERGCRLHTYTIDDTVATTEHVEYENERRLHSFWYT